MPTKITTTNPKTPIKETTEENVSNLVPTITKPKAYLLILLGILIVAAFYFKQYIVAAVVNNKPIYRFSVVKELESQGGKQALDALVTQELIRQEAQKKNITVSEADLDKKINELDAQFKSQGQTFDKVLETQGLTREGVKSQLAVQVMLEKLLGDKIQVTDKEVEAAYQEQKEVFAQEKDLSKVKTTIKDTLKNQKLSSEAQKLLQEVKKSAKITYFVTY